MPQQHPSADRFPYRHENYQSKDFILTAIIEDAITKRDSITKELERYWPSDSRDDLLISLSFQSQKQYLEALSALVFNTVQADIHGSISLDRLPFDKHISQSLTEDPYLMHIYPQVSKEAMREAVEHGKEIGVKNYLEILVPTTVTDETMRELYPRPLTKQQLIRNLHITNDENGIYILRRPTRIPGTYLEHRLAPSQPEPERFLFFEPY